MGENLKKISNSNYIFKSPELSFASNATLITSIIIGHSYTRRLHRQLTRHIEHPEVIKTYRRINCLKNNPNSVLGLRALKKTYLQIITDNRLSPSGPYDIKGTVKKLAEYLGISIKLFDQGGCNLAHKEPKELALNKPEINLLITTTRGQGEEDKARVDFITNFSKYIKPVGHFCVLCEKRFRTKYHKCFHKKRCFACQKIKIETGEFAFLTKQNSQSFCFFENEKTCAKCGTRTRGKKCHKLHQKNIRCRLRKTCPKCKKIYYIQDKTKIHSCENSALCMVCREYYNPIGKKHYCKLQRQKESKYFPGLTFWDVESTVKNTPTDCLACFKLEAAYLKKVKKTWSQLKPEEKISCYCQQHKKGNPEEKSTHKGTKKRKLK